MTAAAFYTLDGTTPSTSSTTYSGTAITIGVTESLKAIAEGGGGCARSPVRSAHYVIQ